MIRILAETEQEVEDIGILMNKKIPNYRQAYSDRTSFIMACLSEIVYLRFNEAFFNKDDKRIIDKLSLLIDEEKLDSFKKLYDIFGYDYKEELSKLKNELTLLNIELVKTFEKMELKQY